VCLGSSSSALIACSCSSGEGLRRLRRGLRTRADVVEAVAEVVSCGDGNCCCLVDIEGAEILWVVEEVGGVEMAGWSGAIGVSWLLGDSSARTMTDASTGRESVLCGRVTPLILFNPRRKHSASPS